jgi:phosphohistidine phosphatase SixA
MRAIIAGLLLVLLATHAFADETLWAKLRGGGHVVLMRHAQAPGGGDPPGFKLDDCATQRNLSAEGRAQAAASGEAFSARKITVSRVLSSRWCRALDTARIAFGTVTPEPVLDSFFGQPEQRAKRTEGLSAIVRKWSTEAGNLVLVTHQVNITALTQIVPAEGEMIVLAARPDGRIGVVGRLSP